jgi:hypothetical protein
MNLIETPSKRGDWLTDFCDKLQIKNGKDFIDHVYVYQEERRASTMLLLLLVVVLLLLLLLVLLLLFLLLQVLLSRLEIIHSPAPDPRNIVDFVTVRNELNPFVVKLRVLSQLYRCS